MHLIDIDLIWTCHDLLKLFLCIASQNRSPKVNKYKINVQSAFWSSFVQKNYFTDLERLNSGQGHQVLFFFRKYYT